MTSYLGNPFLVNIILYLLRAGDDLQRRGLRAEPPLPEECDGGDAGRAEEQPVAGPRHPLPHPRLHRLQRQRQPLRRGQALLRVPRHRGNLPAPGRDRTNPNIIHNLKIDH